MKKIALMTLLAVGVCAVQAEDKKPAPTQDAPKRGEGFRGGYAKALGLTADQQAKLEAFSKEQREKMAGLKDLSQEQRRAKFEEFGKARQAFMDTLLTAEQKAKFKDLRQRRPDKAPEKK
jgi:Spy/CpxP family protein refolding chaperone